MGLAEKIKVWDLIRSIFIAVCLTVSSFAQITVTNTDDSGTGSLRWAIDQANSVTGESTIQFDIPVTDPGYQSLTGTWRIEPVSELPEISESLIISGLKDGLPAIELNGSSQPTGPGLLISASNSEIEGLIITGFPESGLEIIGSENSIVSNNYLGIGPNGVTTDGNGLYGLRIISGTGTQVLNNLISGNGDHGIWVSGSFTSGVIIRDNNIGTDLSGTIKKGNAGHGVFIQQSFDVTIQENLISGNGLAGIEINDATQPNFIIGNLVGTTESGIDALGNQEEGILINNASEVIIGGLNPSERNIISANGDDGIEITKAQDLATKGVNNTVIGNYIGVGSDGLTPMGNAASGLFIRAENSTIGGSEDGAGNTIAYNSHGIRLRAGFISPTINNSILGNSIFSNSLIGIDIDITSGGGFGGVIVENDSDDSDSGPNNLQNFPDITSSVFDEISNSIEITYTLSSDPGFSAYPVQIEFFKTITGERQGKELLGTDSYSETDFTNGEKTINLTIPAGIVFETGDQIVATATDNQGNTSEFSEPVSEEVVLGPEDFIVVNTNDSGDGSLRNAIENVNLSSEQKTITFDIPGSGPHIIQPQSQFDSFVNPVILDASTQPGYSPGSPQIVLDGSLTDDISGFVFTGTADGSTVKGFSIINFKSTADDPTFAIRFVSDSNKVEGNLIGITPEGTAAGNDHGISIINSEQNRIGGILPEQRNVISGNTVGIDFVPGSGNNIVEGNYIGTTVDGTSAIGNKFNIQIRGSINNRIGGSTPEQRNIIAGAFFEQVNGVNTGGSGIVLTAGTNSSGVSVNPSGNVIQGNYIGTDVSGAVSLTNERAGVLLLFGANNNLVGGKADGEGNLISGNGLYGIFMQGSDTGPVNSNLIQGNFIGTNASGTSALPNEVGIWIMGNSDANRIGTNGTASGGNLISGNSASGILILEGDENQVKGNLIGTDVDGLQAVPNERGIEVQSNSNIVGGTNPEDRNIISGNNMFGIFLNESVDNQVFGNFIGTDITGGTAIAGQFRGVRVSGGSEHKIANNTISGHDFLGIQVDSLGTTKAGATLIDIKGNKIGTDVNGTKRIQNLGGGIILSGSSNNIIGGSNPEDRNIISGSGGISDGTLFTNPGISLQNNSNNNKIQGNYIGTDVNGAVVTDFGNFSHGIDIRTGSSGNIIGLDENGNGAGNIIAGNGVVSGNGVTVRDNSLDNRVSGNRIFSNNGIGIDLQNDGITTNDTDDADTGPNNLQNNPVLNAAVISTTTDTISISYSISSDPVNSEYPLKVEFYLNESTRQGKDILGIDSFLQSDFGSQKLVDIVIPTGLTVSESDEITAVAIDASGNSSEFAATTLVESAATVPDVPLLATPADEAADVSVSPLFTWQAATGADSYDIQVSTNVNFSTTIIDESGITNTEFQSPALEHSTQYFWRVRASNQAGQSAWSAAWSFTTEAEPLSPPDVVSLASPGNKAVDVSVTPLLSWDEAAGATTYEVELSGVEDFSAVAFSADGIDSTGIQLDSLEFETTYFWRVRGVNAAGAGDWSAAWNFTTEPEPQTVPSAPQLTFPKNEALDVETDVSFEWQASAETDNYIFQLSLFEDFSSLAIQKDSIDETSFFVENLEELTKYYWRVRAVNEAGESDWSEIWNFTTMLITSNEEFSEIPVELELEQNYPNPFNPSTQINFGLPQAGHVKLQVFNLLGKKIVTLVDGSMQAGRQSVTFNASNLPSGMYIYRLETASNVLVRKMILIK